MRRKGHSHRRKGKDAGIRNLFWIAAHLGIARAHAGDTAGVPEEPAFRLWDAWRYAYPEGPVATQSLMIE